MCFTPEPPLQPRYVCASKCFVIDLFTYTYFYLCVCLCIWMCDYHGICMEVSSLLDHMGSGDRTQVTSKAGGQLPFPAAPYCFSSHTPLPHLMCVHVLPACVCTRYVHCSQRPEEGARITDSCELPCYICFMKMADQCPLPSLGLLFCFYSWTGFCVNNWKKSGNFSYFQCSSTTLWVMTWWPVGESRGLWFVAGVRIKGSLTDLLYPRLVRVCSAHGVCRPT